MKLSSLVGLPVTSLDSGQAVGEIKKLLVDVDPKQVEFIVLNLYGHESDTFAVHLFRYSDLQGVGDVAVTFQSIDLVRTISSEALYQQVFADQISIAGSRVISNVGNDLGILKDFSFDNESGTINAVALEENGQTLYYKAEPYLLISEKCLVLNPDQLISPEEYMGMDQGNMGNVDVAGFSAQTPSQAAAPAQAQVPEIQVPDVQQPISTASSAADFGLPADFQGPAMSSPEQLEYGYSNEYVAQQQQYQDPGQYQADAGYGGTPSTTPPADRQPGRTFQQHIPGQPQGHQFKQQAPQPPVNSYDLADPQVPEVPAAQKRAGGLFFRKNKKQDQAPEVVQQPEPRVEETMNDQDMLDVMKGFLKS